MELKRTQKDRGFGYKKAIDYPKTEKFECNDCGCYYYVDDRDDFDCPNCEDMEQTERCIMRTSPQKNNDE